MVLDVNGWASENKKFDDAEVSKIEKELGVKFPQSYISLMKDWNGGYLHEEHQILIENDVPEDLIYYLGERFWTVGSVAGISADLNNSEGIINKSKTAHEWGIPEKVIAFDGDGHTWVAFDYRDNPDKPKIIFIESDELLSFFLASDFSDFISKLIPSSQVYDNDGNVIFEQK
ncbi:SMI1/KNR4 family protein [Gallaecimonas pentaromativorans]|nr:SMI1/KNR4 family protein [Gallaecimonas pentaromativorans]